MRALFFLLAFSSQALAQDLIESAEGAGRAGVGLATPEGDTALFVNPAGASLTPFLVTGALYQLLTGEGSVISAIAVDGTAPYADGGVALSGFFSKELTIGESRVISSIPLGARSAFGVSQTTFYRSDLPKDEGQLFLSADVGAVLGLGQKLSLGATVFNAVHSRVPDRRRLGEIGASLTLKGFTFSGEGGLDFTPDELRRPIGRAAVEWGREGRITLRGGYAFDATRATETSPGRHAAALGLTYHDQRSTLDIAWEQRLSGEGGSRLTVGIRFFLAGMSPPQTR